MLRREFLAISESISLSILPRLYQKNKWLSTGKMRLLWRDIYISGSDLFTELTTQTNLALPSAPFLLINMASDGSGK